MTANSVLPSFPTFKDVDGLPLEGGFIYIGLPNLNPEVAPKQAYFDKELTVPAPQPIRTIGGYPSRNGTPSQIYVDGEFSLTVRDKNGALIYNAATEQLRFSPLISGIYDFQDVATLLADTGSGFGAGSIWRTRSEGFSYEEAPSSATDHHVTTAGGVKLKVLPDSAGEYPADAFPSLASALLALAGIGVTIRCSGKTYTISGSSGLSIPRKTAVVGIAEKTKFSFTGPLSGSRLVKFETAIQRCPTLTAAAASFPSYTFEALSNQRVGLNYVTCTTAANAARFSAGDFVMIGAGIDPIDGDDAIPRYQQIFRVMSVDAANGRVYLDGAVDDALSDDDFAAGAGGNLAVAWANTTGYTAGDFVLSNNTGTGTGTAVWKASTSGTSSGTGPGDDTGVAWVKLVDTQGALAGTRDCRPIIFKVPEADVVYDSTIKDVIISNDAGSLAVAGFQVTSTLNVSIENCPVAGGDLQIAYYVREAARIVRIVRPDWKVLQSASGSERGRALSLYSAREVLVEQADFLCGLNLFAGVFLEGSADLTIANSEISAGFSDTGTGSRFYQGGPSNIRLLGNRIKGFGTPMRLQLITQGFATGRKFGQHSASGNLFTMSAFAFRGGNNDDLLQFWPGNSYRIFGNNAAVEDIIQIDDAQIVKVAKTFTPANSAVGVGVEFDDIGLDGVVRAAYGPAVFLGCEVFWSAPPAGQDFNARPRVRQASGAFRNAGAGSGPDNLVAVSDTNPRASKFIYTGDVPRTVGKDERLNFSYFSSASASTGGPVTVVFTLLK